MNISWGIFLYGWTTEEFMQGFWIELNFLIHFFYFLKTTLYKSSFNAWKISLRVLLNIFYCYCEVKLLREGVRENIYSLCNMHDGNKHTITSQNFTRLGKWKIKLFLLHIRKTIFPRFSHPENILIFSLYSKK